MDNYGTQLIVPEYPDGPVIEEQNHNPLENLFPNILNPAMNMESAPVLHGGECRSGFSLTINSINHL